MWPNESRSWKFTVASDLKESPWVCTKGLSSLIRRHGSMGYVITSKDSDKLLPFATIEGEENLEVEGKIIWCAKTLSPNMFVPVADDSSV